MSATARRLELQRRAAAAIRALRDEPPRDQPLQDEPNPPIAEEPAISPLEAADRSDFQNIRRLLAFALQTDDNCVDIGANRGSVLSEMVRVAPLGRHIAFEPLPHLATLLRESFPAVDVHEAALSNHAGSSEFAYVEGSSEGCSGFIFRELPTDREVTVQQIEVRVEVLDDVLDPDYRPALIKIDVEGAEQQVIEGALNTLRRHKPIVVFEHGLGSANVYGTEPADIHRLFNDGAGLRIFDLDGEGPYSLAEFERAYNACERVNFVARP